MKKLFLALIVAFLSGTAVPCQDPLATENVAKELDAARSRLESTADTEENKPWRKEIQKRIALLEQHSTAAANRKKIETEGRNVETEKETAGQELEQTKLLPEPEAPDLRDIKDLGAELQKLEDEETRCKTQAGTLEATREATKEQIAKARAEQGTIDKKLTELDKNLEQLTADDALTSYIRTNTIFEKGQTADLKVYLIDGIRHWTARLPLIELQIEKAKIDHARATKVLELARDAAKTIREQRALEARRISEEEEREAKLARDPVERIIRSKLALASRLRADTAVLKIQIDNKKTQFNREEKETARSIDQLETLEQRLQFRGRNSTDSFLSKTLERTRRTRDLLSRDQIPETDGEIEVTQGSLAEALDGLFELELPDHENLLLDELYAAAPATEQKRVKQRFDELLNGSENSESGGLLRAYIDKIDALETLSNQFVKISNKQLEHVEKLQELDSFLRRQMFWIQSDPPINWRILRLAGSQTTEIFAPFLATDWTSFSSVLFARPLVLLLAFILLGLTFVPGVRKYRLRRDDEDTRPRHIVEHLIYALIRAAILPAGLAICARILDQDNILEPPIADGLVDMLDIAATLLFVRFASVTLLNPTGVFVQFKLLVSDVAAQLLRALKFFTAISLFTWPLHAVLKADGFELEALQRVLETLWLTGTVLTMIYLINGRGAMVQKWTRPDGITRKIWGFVWPILSLQLLTTVVLYVLGYTIGALQLSGNASKSLLAAIMLSILYRVSIRLAAKSTATMRTKMIEQGEGEAWSENSASTFQFMTRLAAITIIVIAAFILQQLWGIGGNVRDALGSLTAFNVGEAPGMTVVTYLDIFYALLWIVGGHVVAHNVGRSNELIFVPLVGDTNKGGRYAFITLTRYGILLIAWCGGLLAMHISFEKLGWVLTAASVGIGFGLQEIVANFISGLILLFERPIRVGDIVTVGDTEGTVEKITIRATVVTNWERQTIIVPNKTFITQNLTNWTRNDHVMRRTLTFGVAHGSDVEKVLGVLSEEAERHPCVLEEPPHRIWFRGIGEFTLNFEVWIFASINDGLRTRSELYGSIYRRLELEGIRIPLPQTETRLIGDNKPGTSDSA